MKIKTCFLNLLNIFNIKEAFDYEKYNNINNGLYQLSIDLIEKLNMSVKNINLTQEEFNKAKYALRYGEPFHVGEKFKINNNYVKNYIIKKFSLSNERIEKLFNIKINKWINEKINLAITGCMGRMGRQIIKSAKLNKISN